MPRKFEANIAIVLRNAPRFNSTPVSRTRAGASTAGGAMPGGFSVVLTDLGCYRFPVNWFDANASTQSLCPASRESGHRLGRFLYYMSWERAPRFIFRRNMLDVMELKTNIRAHIVSGYNRVLGAAKIFSQTVLVMHT